MNKLMVFLIKQVLSTVLAGLRVGAVLIVFITAFGVLDRNVGMVHEWVRNTSSYKITIQSYNTNNILDGGITQYDIQPVQNIANMGNLMFMYLDKYISELDWSEL